MPVWVLDDMLWFGPIRRAEDPDLVSLVGGEQLGAVRGVEVCCGRKHNGALLKG